jgi:hypothetical protein
MFGKTQDYDNDVVDSRQRKKRVHIEDEDEEPTEKHDSQVNGVSESQNISQSETPVPENSQVKEDEL